ASAVRRMRRGLSCRACLGCDHRRVAGTSPAGADTALPAPDGIRGSEVQMSRLTHVLTRPAVLQVAVLLVVALSAGCTRMKRFAYEGFLRDRWQHPERVIASLGLQPGAAVADLGSGGGYFTFRLARAVGPTGKVYAADVDQDLNDYIAA